MQPFTGATFGRDLDNFFKVFVPGGPNSRRRVAGLVFGPGGPNSHLRFTGFVFVPGGPNSHLRFTGFVFVPGGPNSRRRVAGLVFVPGGPRSHERFLSCLDFFRRFLQVSEGIHKAFRIHRLSLSAPKAPH